MKPNMKPNKLPTRSDCSGFGLIELMVAMVIGLLILAAVSAIFANSNKNYKTTDSLARLQENARVAIQFLTNDIRRAGHVGCVTNMDNVQIGLNGGNINGVALAPFVGVEGGSANPDSLTLQYFDLETSVPLTASMPNESADLTVPAGHPFKQQDIVAITDCNLADIFQITNNAAGGTTIVHAAGSSPAPGNASAQLSKTYGSDARIMRFSQLQYRIDNSPTTGRKALFRGADELAEGIENLQLLYGLRPDPTSRFPNVYTTANNVTNWRQAVSVRVGLLAFSIADTASGEVSQDIDNAPHTVNDVTIPGAGDKRIRRSFLTNVDLRNVR